MRTVLVWGRALASCAALSLLGPPIAADVVVPSERVRSRVVVRAEPDRASRAVGSLVPGAEAVWLDSLPGWHRVELPDATHGFVSAAWTHRVEAPPPVASRPPAGPPADFHPVAARGLLQRLRDAFAGFLGPRREVDFLVDDHEPAGRLWRSRDPRMPVAGVATPAGTKGLYDIVLVLDASASTNETSRADVDGDGVVETDFRGDDSIFRAQLVAARGFLVALSRLPGNASGERIRVGVILFSGDERFHLEPADRDFVPREEAVFALGRRDARLEVPLTHDYAGVDARLRELDDLDPRGMTNFAAGIARAIAELEGSAREGGRSERRDGAEPVIDFLTDGAPSLPYGERVAEDAARFAAGMAAERGIRLNTFELGRNAVTRRMHPAMEEVARGGGGSLVHIERPGDIVSILRGTPLSFVERVKLVNRTTQLQSDYIATAVDGSFYGEVPLVPGDNEVEIVAVLHDGSEDRERFPVRYVDGDPIPQLRERLARLRARNEALIDQIRARLASEMDTARRAQHKSLRLRESDETD